MSRQFKASTFFNKYIPFYIVQYEIDEHFKYHYFYEFNDNIVDPAVSDFCESRMLVAIYSLASIYENKIITPSGKLVNLDDFSKDCLTFLKNISSKFFYYIDSSINQRHSDFNVVRLSSLNLKKDITYEEFIHTDFYLKDLLDIEIITRANYIMQYFKHPTRAIEFILNFELNKNPDFVNLAKYCDLIIEEDNDLVIDIKNENTEDSELFSLDDSNDSLDEPSVDSNVLKSAKELFLLSIVDKKNIIKEKNIIKKENQLNAISHLISNESRKRNPVLINNYAISDLHLQKYLNFSEFLLNNPYDLILFKMIDKSRKKIIFLADLYESESEKFKQSTLVENIEKNAVIEKFKESYDLYSYNDSKLRADTLEKIEFNYDLPNSIKIFSHFPYSAKQYENQSYLPLMIKAPVKTVTETMISKVDELIYDFPHFNEVINYISLSLKMRLKTNNILGFKHILIVGNHGIGKNEFIKRLYDILDYVGSTLSMPSIMAPFELAGMDVGWNGSSPGFFFKSLVRNDAANPIIVLDDVDKVNVTHHGNINITISDLLDPSNAKTYYENFFQTNIDMSNVTVIGLANTLETVDKGLLNLFKVFEISPPKIENISSIAFSVYKGLKQESIYFDIVLSDSEINELVAKFIMRKVTSPRSIRKVLEESMNFKLIEYTENRKDLNNTNNDEVKLATQLLDKTK